MKHHLLIEPLQLSGLLHFLFFFAEEFFFIAIMTTHMLFLSIHGINI